VLVKDPTIFAQGPQPSSPDEGAGSNNNALTKFAVGGSAFVGSGFIKTKNGRMWDKYLDTVRAVESGSPGGILKTFRTSEFYSSLESWSNLNVSKIEMGFSGDYREYLQSVFGKSESLSMSRTGAVFGEVRDSAGKLRGYGLNMELAGAKGSAIGDYFARIQGVEVSSLNDSILRAKYLAANTPQSYVSWLEDNIAANPAFSKQRAIIGARLRNEVSFLGNKFTLTEGTSKLLAKAETVGNLLRAKSATSVGRLNQLLKTPLEIPVIGDFLHKIPGARSMAVKPGSTLGMLRGFATKALLVQGAWTGLEYLDYLRSENSIWSPALNTTAGAAIGALVTKQIGQNFSKKGLIAGAAIGLFTAVSPRFEKGLFHGTASIFTDAKIAGAQISDSIGLTESVKDQERVTPGFLTFSTALGFAGVGALGTSIYDYSGFVKNAVSKRLSGGKLNQIFEDTRKATTGSLTERIWQSRAGTSSRKVIPGLNWLSKTRIGKSTAGLGAIVGLTAWQTIASGLSLMSGNFMAAIPGIGLLGSNKTAQELQDIYSGREEVPIKAGRWWEFGRSSKYEGGRTQYYRKHAMARLESRSYQKGIWRSEEEKWQYSPFLHPIKALFGSDEWKYHYEQKYQYDRPAPLTSTYGEDIPFIGSAIAATFGKLVKPRKEVRPEEWNLGNGNYLYHPSVRPEEEPSYELGGLVAGAPVAPEEGTQLFNELNYRRREAIGLVGYAEQIQTEALIGREELLPNLQTMATMGKETGSEYWLWKHLNIGGGAGSTEAIRRFIPRTPSYLETYNPLRNNLPSWMPEDYFLDLKYGNPFLKLPEAELRLPGPGYSSLYPEVEGLNPEDYPLAHKVKILGDVAMYSAEYRSHMSMAKRNIKQMSSEEARLVMQTEEQVKDKKKRRNFQEYVFNENQLESEDVTVTDVLSPKRILTKEYGNMVIDFKGVGSSVDEQSTQRAKDLLVGRTLRLYTPTLDGRKFDMVTSGPRMKAVPMLNGVDIGSVYQEQGIAESAELEDEFKQLRFSENEKFAGKLSETILHGMENPMDYLTPASPVSKMIRQRSAVEEYVASEAIGTSNAFWNKPVEHFLKPASNLIARKMGDTSIPDEVQERRDINEYFDMLKWTKYSRIEQQAREAGDLTTAASAYDKKGTTVFGVDAYKNPTNILRALPRRERDFFNEFAGATTEEERAQILQLVPENQQRIYLAQWFNQSARAAQAKSEAGIATAEDNNTLNIAQMVRATEGFPYEQDMEERWAAETNGNIAFDDWIRDQKAEEYFSSHSLPGADWIGWNPAVDLEDVKMQYVEQAGCISKETILFTKDIKTIKVKELKEGHKIMNSNSDITEIKKVFRNKNNGETYKLSNSGSFEAEMIITGNHVVPVLRPTNSEYRLIEIPVREIRTKDKMLYPKLHFEETKTEIDLLDYVDKNKDSKIKAKHDDNNIWFFKTKKYPRKITIDKEFGFFLGTYIAEGSLEYRNNKPHSIQLSLSLKEIDLANKIKEYLLKFNIKTSIKREKKAKALRVSISNTFLASVILSFCNGKNATEKQLTEDFFKLPKESILASLYNWFIGDGSVDKRINGTQMPRNLTIQTSSKLLARQGWYLLNSFGIRSRLQFVKARPNKLCKNASDSYRLNIGDKIAKIAFLSTKEISQKDYFERITIDQKLEQYFWFGVSIRPIVCDEEVLYDFDMGEPHFYTTSCGIVHNSDYHDFDLWGQRERAMSRKPYINPTMVSEMQEQATYESYWTVNKNAKNLINLYGKDGSTSNTSKIEGGLRKDSYNIEIRDGRERLVDKAYDQLGA
jgi:hypothetical protein